jgi:hypothetical protein
MNVNDGSVRSPSEMLGFRRIGRDAAPPEIQRSAEFSSLCASSATVMGKP